jgi:hypothetical protein
MVVAIYDAWTLKDVDVQNHTEFQAFVKESDDGYDITSDSSHGSESRKRKRECDDNACVEQGGASSKQPRLGDKDEKIA